MTTRSLVDALIAGDSMGIEKAFNDTIGEKINDALDQYRVEVAQDMFEDTVEVVEEDFDDVSLEDIEAFMQTEEYEQLDELSRKTLASYVNKAASDMAVSHGKQLQKQAAADETDNFTNRHMNDKYVMRDKIKAALGATSKDIRAMSDRTAKRHSGIAQATGRLAKEEAEQVDEVLTKNQPASAWIKDFVHSDDPRFKGASKKERMKRALAAYYAKQRGE